MSLGGTISGSIRGLLIAAVAGGAVLGLLVVFHPLSPPPSAPIAVVTGDPAADALRTKIAVARDALAKTETALGDAKPTSLRVVAPGIDPGQIEAQIAAATERRDLALRHAQAIGDALKSGVDLSALAEIRDSVVVGQLLTRQAALDGQIAEQGARFKPNHPTMRALNGQKAALVAQIKAEAAGIATALDAEAKLDDAQVKRLQSQLAGAPLVAGATSADNAALQARATAQRGELDGLVDAYFNLAPRNATPLGARTTSDILTPLNLFVVAVAAIATLMLQIAVALRRRRLHRAALAADLSGWQRDHDPVVRNVSPAGELRRAS